VVNNIYIGIESQKDFKGNNISREKSKKEIDDNVDKRVEMISKEKDNRLKE